MRLLIALTASAALLLLAAPGYGATAPAEPSQTPTAEHGGGWTTAVVVNPPVVAGRLVAGTPFFRPKGSRLPSADTLTPTPTPTPTATFKPKGARLPSADTLTPTPSSQ